MPIEGFDFKEFARIISEQVGPALPPDLSEPDKQYIINIVHNFCYMAGEGISNDTSINFNAEQASMVAQFIGEWAFHKAIDTIKSGIEPQFRDSILQKVAFTVYEIAKTAIMKNMPQDEMIAIVEFHVKKSYMEALQELQNKGVLTEAQVLDAQSRSNIDDMANQAAQVEAEAQANGSVGASNGASSVASNFKILKLATLSMIIKKLPKEKIQGVLGKLAPEDAQILSDYASMDDLESRLDASLVERCLSEIKSSLPKSKKINKTRLSSRLYNIVNNSNNSKISNIINKERDYIKELVKSSVQGAEVDCVSPYVADIVCSHLEEKLSR